MKLRKFKRRNYRLHDPRPVARAMRYLVRGVSRMASTPPVAWFALKVSP